MFFGILVNLVLLIVKWFDKRKLFIVSSFVFIIFTVLYFGANKLLLEYNRIGSDKDIANYSIANKLSSEAKVFDDCKQIAIQYADIQLLDLPLGRCFSKVLKLTNDLDKCMEIAKPFLLEGLCISDYASITNDPKYCELLGKTDSIENCKYSLKVSEIGYNEDYFIDYDELKKVFSSITDIEQCSKFTNIDSRDACRIFLSIKDNKAEYCFKSDYGYDFIYAKNCINDVAKYNNNPSQCANIYLTGDASRSTSFGSLNYDNYKDCLTNTLTEGESLENASIEGCKSMNIEISPLDSGITLNMVASCFGNVAHEYNKPEYCDYLENEVGSGLSERDLCLYYAGFK